MTRALIDGEKIISCGKGNYSASGSQIVIEVVSWPYDNGRKLRKSECYYNGNNIIAKTQTMLDNEEAENKLKLKNDILLGKLRTYILNTNTFIDFKEEISGIKIATKNK